MNRALRAAAVLAVASGGLVAVAAAPAQSADAEPDTCVAVLAKGETAPVDTACFSDFRALASWVTDGEITDAPREAAVAAEDEALQDDLAALDAVVIGVEYEHEWLGGASITVIGEDGPCTGELTDLEYAVVNVGWEFAPPPGQGFPWWNDRVSSFTTGGNCWSNHFADEGFGGRNTGFVPIHNHLGGMNDATTSIIWS